MLVLQIPLDLTKPPGTSSFIFWLSGPLLLMHRHTPDTLFHLPEQLFLWLIQVRLRNSDPSIKWCEGVEYWVDMKSDSVPRVPMCFDELSGILSDDTILREHREKNNRHLTSSYTALWDEIKHVLGVFCIIHIERVEWHFFLCLHARTMCLCLFFLPQRHSNMLKRFH